MSIKSVHLESFPKYSEEKINQALIDDFGIVRAIVSVVLGIRKNANVPVKVPLQEVIIYKSKGLNVDLVTYSQILQDEVNIKNITIKDGDFEEIANVDYKLNFSVCGKKFGEKIKEIKKLIDEKNFFAHGETLSFPGLGLTLNLHERECEVFYSPKSTKFGVGAACENKILIAVDLEITLDSRLEYCARRVVRAIQNERKQLNLNLNQKLKSIEIASSSQEIRDAIVGFEAYIKGETLLDGELIFVLSPDVEDFALTIRQQD